MHDQHLSFEILGAPVFFSTTGKLPEISGTLKGSPASPFETFPVEMRFPFSSFHKNSTVPAHSRRYLCKRGKRAEFVSNGARFLPDQSTFSEVFGKYKTPLALSPTGTEVNRNNGVRMITSPFFSPAASASSVPTLDVSFT